MDAMTDDERYAAISARDARFDGVFFTCVQTTGIFCRPSCPARTPARGSVRFVRSAAAAIDAGFRACKRCGPAAPPGSPDADPVASLADRALRLIDAGALDADGSVAHLAVRLAVSERTLHRALVAATGTGALTHARVRRARRAHDLTVATDLPLAEVAYAAGFGSERQLHDVFTRIYGHAPSVVRGRRAARSGAGSGVLRARLAVRRPFDGLGLAAWFAGRAIPGVESVDGTRWTRAVRLAGGPAVLSVDLGASDGPLDLEVRLGDLRDYPAAVALTRRMLDLDADPVGIERGLAAAVPELTPLIERRPGVRIPGTPTLAEALLWAIVGQQISTRRARELIVAATDLLAEPLPPALRVGEIERLAVDPGTAGRRAEDWFRGPAARRRALIAALTATPDDALPLPDLRAALLAIPGVGPWTADYALLRGVRAIDVAPAPDVALLASARALGLVVDHHELNDLLSRAAPWRSYAALHLWQAAAPVEPVPAPAAPEETA